MPSGTILARTELAVFDRSWNPHRLILFRTTPDLKESSSNAQAGPSSLFCLLIPSSLEHLSLRPADPHFSISR